MTNSYHVMYLRAPDGSPIGCVAFNQDGIYLDYQVSVINPIDKFNREVSRSLAVGRLLSQPHTAYLSSANASKHDLIRKVMQTIERVPELPSRARRAAHRWLRDNPLQAQVEHDPFHQDLAASF